MAGVLPPPDAPPRVMAVLNATPDSFSGDGLSHDPDALVQLAAQAVADGADILDLGGESTRPAARPVSVEEERARVMTVLPRVLQLGVPVSIDTSKPRVADSALALGAVVLNDVSGLADPDLASLAAEHGAYLVLTHNGWTTGHGIDVLAKLQMLVQQALKAGLTQDRLILDPGLGFGKRPQESLAVLRDLGRLVEGVAPLPVLVGASRKGFIGQVLDLPPDDRLEGSLACAAIATLNGASVLRVHDVRPSVRVARVAWAVRGSPRLSSRR